MKGSTNSNKKNFLLLIGTIFLLEAWSCLSLLFLPIKNTPLPWTIFSLIQYGFYIELIVSGVILMTLIGLVIAYYVGGAYRILSFYLLALLLLIFTGLILSVCFFVYFAEIQIESLTGFIHILLFSYENESDLLILFLLIVFLTPFALILALTKNKLSKKDKALGDAHFSTAIETCRAGFFKKEEGAILIGKKYGAPLWSNGFEHVLVFAPTGSGKTRGIGMPNLFQYPYSVVCNDVKLTMYKTTAKYREEKLGQKCFCWAPTDEEGNTHRYNPLALISDDKIQRITDIQRIAHILIPDSKKSDPIWQQASRKLFKAIVLYLLDTPEKATTLGEINRLLKKQCFDDWLATTLEEANGLDEDFYRNSYSYLNNHEKTRSSILETLTGYFELFEDPRIDAATSSSDFDIRNLRKEKITIYIGFSDDDMERLAPILTLFWQQLISAMIRKVPDKEEEPYPLLCLLDEFSSLGRIERLRRSLKLLREYRVRCVLMMQYIAQTYEQYTQDEAKAFTNIKTKVAFATDDIQDAEYISKLLGYKTVKISNNSSSFQLHGQSWSKNYNSQAVRLMREEEIMKLPEFSSIIIKSGYNPLLAKKAYG